MKPNQTAVKLSLNKAVVTVLTQERMMNYQGKNGQNNNFPTQTNPPPTDTEITCSAVPTCNTTTTDFASW